MDHTTAPAPVPVRKPAPKFVRWAVMLALVVVLNIFFYVARGVIFPEPQFEQFCPVRTTAAPADEASCTAAQGIWNRTPVLPPGDAVKTLPVTGYGYCDLTTKCQQQYTNALKPYKLHAFMLMIGLGVVALIIGALPLGASIVSTGLSYGGVLAFIIASIQYWSEANSLLRLAIATIALVILIGIGLKRFRD